MIALHQFRKPRLRLADQGDAPAPFAPAAGAADLVDAQQAPGGLGGPVPIGIARAYSGAAHGRRWRLPDPANPPSIVELTIDGRLLLYRLALNPIDGWVARARVGALVYIPTNQDPVGQLSWSLLEGQSAASA